MSTSLAADSPRWTDAQWAAMRSTGANLLVSAGAGSGKTAVLAQRCAFLVADAAPPCGVDQLLVVTFTDAAAGEMRHRIAAALRERLAARPDDRRLAEQIALLDSAAISTLHAFCKRVLSRFFAPAGLDPGFAVLDAREAELLRGEVVHELFAELHAGNDRFARRFEYLVDRAGRGTDDRLAEVVLSLAAFTESVVDGHAWLDRQVQALDGCTRSRLSLEWSHRRRQAIVRELRSLDDRLRRIADECDASRCHVIGDMGRSARAFSDRLATGVSELERASADADVDAICARIAGMQPPELPNASRAETKRAIEGFKTEYVSLRAALRSAYEDDFKEQIVEQLAGVTAADWARGILRTRSQVGTLVELVRRFLDRYARAKRARAAVDFADLERCALNLLRDPARPDQRTAVGRWLSDQFEHVLVDEFQDINPVQAEILARVSRQQDPAGRPPNLFVVGDVKQSIYRFRLAEPKVFVERARRAAEAPPGGRDQRIDLSENFRSDRPVLEFVNRLFDRLMAGDLGDIRFDAAAHLRAGTEAQRQVAGPAVELHVLEDQADAAPDQNSGEPSPDGPQSWERVEREGYAIAERIRELIAETGGKLSYRDIVILMRSPRRAAPLLVRTLRKQGIPVFAELAGGFFESLEIRDMLALLRLLDNEQQDIELAAHLRSPLCRHTLSDSDLVRIRVAGSRDTPFHVTFAEYGEKGDDAGLRDRVRAIRDDLAQLRERVRLRPLPEVIADILQSNGYAARVAAMPDGPQRVANLAQLHQYAREFATFSRQGLHRFLRFLDAMRADEQDMGVTPPLSAAADVVRIMSIHQSKGLEFPVVFVAELGKKFNFQDGRGDVVFDRELGLGLKWVDARRRIVWPTLPQRLVCERLKDETLAEELRILYVALTRARRRLVLVGTASRNELDALLEARAPSPSPDGLLPLTVRRAAERVLDWLIPALATWSSEQVIGLSDRPNPNALVRLRCIPSGEMAAWKLGTAFEEGVRARRARFAEKAEIPADIAIRPASPDSIDGLLARLTSSYAHAASTRQPAVLAASALKRLFEPMHDPDDPHAPAERVIAAPRLRRPTFIETGPTPPDAADRGSWTHLLMQHVDLARPCDEADLREQLRHLVSVGVLTEAAARSIDVAAIAWFFQHPLGQRMRAATDSVRREVPFVYGLPADRTTRGDRVLVRGIIDCYFDEPGGVVLLDYKTDAVGEADVPARVEHYRPQIELYAQALEAIWCVRISERVLVFLGPRQVVSVPAIPLTRTKPAAPAETRRRA